MSKYLALLLLGAGGAANAQDVYDDAICHVNPDPHFRPWDGNYYDFHHGCDLVLVRNDLMEMHIRTEVQGGYSDVQQAAVKIGSDTLEVREDGTVLLNGVGGPIGSVGGYAFSTSVSGASTDYEITLNAGQFVRISHWYSSLSIQIQGNGAQFSGSTGLCGSWTPAPSDTFEMRNGSQAADATSFGLEWQVGTADPVLLSTAAAPVCSHPTPGQGHGDIDPEEACADVPAGPEQDNCIFDVTQTGDVTFAQHPFYVEAPVVKPFCFETNKCFQAGGKCTQKCDHTTHDCLKELCDCANDLSECLCAVPKKIEPCVQTKECEANNGQCLPYCDINAIACVDELCGLDQSCTCNIYKKEECPQTTACDKENGKCLPYCDSNAIQCVDELCGDDQSCTCNIYKNEECPQTTACGKENGKCLPYCDGNAITCVDELCGLDQSCTCNIYEKEECPQTEDCAARNGRCLPYCDVNAIQCVDKLCGDDQSCTCNIYQGFVEEVVEEVAQRG